MDADTELDFGLSDRHYRIQGHELFEAMPDRLGDTKFGGDREFGHDRTWGDVACQDAAPHCLVHCIDERFRRDGRCPWVVALVYSSHRIGHGADPVD
jgi:hypothetical protein